jgi:hypothetical protein
MSYGKYPIKPDGISSRAEWTRDVTERIIEQLNIQGGPGVRVDKKVNGIVIYVDSVSAGSTSDGAARWS